MKGESDEAANWTVRNQEFTAGEFRLAIKDRLCKSMQEELNKYPEDYSSVTYEDWCDLLYTIKVKDDSKTAAVYIKKIASARAASISRSDNSVRTPRKKKVRTGILRSNKYHKQAHKHHGINRYCVLCK